MVVHDGDGARCRAHGGTRIHGHVDVRSGRSRAPHARRSGERGISGRRDRAARRGVPGGDRVYCGAGI